MLQNQRSLLPARCPCRAWRFYRPCMLCCCLVALLLPLSSSVLAVSQPASLPPISGPAIEVLVPWGVRDGAVTQQIFSKDEQQRYNGPAAIRVGREGNLFVLDTLGATVERFALDGSHLSTWRYPTVTDYDEEIRATDIACSPDGNTYLLEEARRAVMTFDSTGALTSVAPLPLSTGFHILVGLECDDEGNLYLIDGADNSVVRFKPGQRKAVRAFSDLAPNKVMDGQGRFYGADSSGAVSLHDPFGTGKTTTIAQIESQGDLAEAHVRGLDSAGRIYVEVAEGTIERPSRRRIVVFTAAGDKVQHFAIPGIPRRMYMTRARAVLPQGGIICVRVTSKGLLLQRYPLD